MEAIKKLIPDSLKSADDSERSRIIMLVDETGSMQSAKAVTISSYNEWLDSNRTKEEDEDHFPKFTLVKFNTTCRMMEQDSVETATRLTHENYSPNNMTALYDAIGETLTTYKNEKDNIMVMITDGQENSSRKFNQTQVKKMIEEYTEKKGWIFHYLGANQDAWEVGQSIGISKKEFCNTYSADDDGFDHVFKQNIAQTKCYRGYQAKKKKGMYVPSLQELDVPTIEKKSTSSAPQPSLNFSNSNRAPMMKKKKGKTSAPVMPAQLQSQIQFQAPMMQNRIPMQLQQEIHNQAPAMQQRMPVQLQQHIQQQAPQQQQQMNDDDLQQALQNSMTDF